MKLQELRPPFGAHKRKKRLGCGESSGHGKTSTRGNKGQKSRSGSTFHPWFEGGQNPLIRRIPKRGFTHWPKEEFEIINLKDLNKFNDGAEVDLKKLKEAGFIKNVDKRVKILGEGELTRKLTVKAHAFSKKAKESISKSGGKAVEVARS
ncbi:MAG: 50S ribosomal protein L15 [Candidatus Omnitrophica bacterium]|nr:50S ribosomal protein L15 [Candidatus Omnitrophota bacterium]